MLLLYLLTFNIHVDIPGGDNLKFLSVLDSCNLKQLTNQLTCMVTYLITLGFFSSDQDSFVDVNICEFMSDHAVIKCTIDFHCSVFLTKNRVFYRRCHCIDMSDLCI